MLKYYANDREFITIVPWAYVPGCDPFRLCQMTMLEDCLYQTVGRYQWLVAGDLDELIYVPGKTLMQFANQEKFNVSIPFISLGILG